MWKRSDATTWRYKMFPQRHNAKFWNGNLDFSSKLNKKLCIFIFSPHKNFFSKQDTSSVSQGLSSLYRHPQCQIHCQIIPKRMIKKTPLEQSNIPNVFFRPTQILGKNGKFPYQKNGKVFDLKDRNEKKNVRCQDGEKDDGFGARIEYLGNKKT